MKREDTNLKESKEAYVGGLQQSKTGRGGKTQWSYSLKRENRMEEQLWLHN